MKTIAARLDMKPPRMRLETTNYTERLVDDSLKLPLDYASIQLILPHRYPFLLVVRIT
jgi:hypothetical protein